MKFLWAPWRMTYILKGGNKGCFFCRNLKEKDNKKNLILLRGKNMFITMNKYPYTNGHLMIVPKRHCLSLEELNDDESKEFFDLLKLTVQVLKTSLHPQGFNIGANIGRVGGAGEDHLHLHIVPRWSGDTNFMPVIGETKVVPEYLDKTYKVIQAAFMNQLKKRTRLKGG